MAKDRDVSNGTVIAGAGPAGLTAAYELSKHGHPCVILEQSPIMVGGISRTDIYKGYRFDIGGHRFFSKSDEINQFWREVLGDELLVRSRLSRIYYDRKFFNYPLKPIDALSKLGIWRSFRILASYAKAQWKPIVPERSFEDWVVNRFGRLLFEIFFKTYTEKVWGMPTSAISADWAAQRIKGLNLVRAVLNSLKIGGPKSGRAVVKTLIDSFLYPRLGPGQMWEVTRDKVLAWGGELIQDREVVRVEHRDGLVRSLVARDALGEHHSYRGSQFLSTLPIRDLIASLDPQPPASVVEAAASLKYRDFLTVVLIVDLAETFPDNWIYIHEPKVRLGRIQNFKNWSSELVPDPAKTSLGLEYFCFEGDDLWTATDQELIALGRREIDLIGIVPADKISDGCVVRMPKAYPVYDDGYATRVRVIRDWLASLSNIQLVGRNGMHKYNNQDHSMMSALLAARNILGSGRFDPWCVNTDAEYQEETSSRIAGRMMPESLVNR